MREVYHCQIHVGILITVISLFFNRCCCVDQQYEACVPRNCGSLRISFPFFIVGTQEAYCGSPGFNITCVNNTEPLIRIPDYNEALLVDEIFYDNRSLRVSNAALRSNEGSCGAVREIARNLSVRSDHFEYANDSRLVLLWDCNSSNEARLDRYKVGCDGINYLVMEGNDRNLKLGTEACETRAEAAVIDDEQIVTGSNYSTVMRRGFVLNWRATDCTACKLTQGSCGFDIEHDQFLCFCPDRPHYINCTATQAATTVGVLGGTILLLSVLVIFCCRKKTKQGSFLFSKNVSSFPKDVDAFIKQYGSSIPRRFRYSTLKKVTNSFKDELGKGGYGTVYRGRLSDGRDVAVKVLNATKGNGEEFINEVASIGRTSHVNVVTLLGFCYEGKRRALIYEFMPNGSLEKFIYGTNPLLEGQHLGWEKLLRIAIGIARGLEYLHRGCNTRILHFDIKPHNILLDKDFCPKISDFGLAKLYTTNESAVSSLLQPRGTIGYIAPEVTSRNFGQVSHKSDVYSYGMMILEMVGGRKNVNAGADHTSEIYYPRWLYKRLQFDDVLNMANEISAEENELVRKMVMVGLWCIQIYPSQMPSISKVIEMLEGQTAALEIPPCPYLCSVPGSPSNSPEKPVFCSSSGTEPT
ncbi:hypothetical protein DCAR_0415660 [Daucus carota subsp. sativus]|uniref:non-specific serine/threonine protein kinase n=1 Tax=Daucus carota subsp. sativus TaxID=79200 RepID=A0AAF0WYM3_DAUCS|nr:hypothetical protein DCAR_0415660 [Daucus carota subsp. sativus]